MKKPFDWTGRIDLEIPCIQCIMRKRISKVEKEAQLRKLLMGLITDVEARTREQLTNRTLATTRRNEEQLVEILAEWKECQEE